MKSKTPFYAMSIAIVVFFFILSTQASAIATQPQVAASESNTVGLKSDGTVVAVGANGSGQLSVESWSDIVQVATDSTEGTGHTVGLKSDGTVVAVGYNYYGQLNVDSWTDIVQVAAGYAHTVGFKSYGTVVAAGCEKFDRGQCDVDSWTDIVQVATGTSHTVGLISDGTVVAAGCEKWDYGQCDVDSWTDIVQVAASGGCTVGLKSDGTVVAVGNNWAGQLNVDNWTDIVQVAAGDGHTVGLKSDGAVVAVGANGSGQLSVESWTDIVQVAAGGAHTVGLKSDGTVVAVGNNWAGQLNVDGWNLKFNPPPVAICQNVTVQTKFDTCSADASIDAGSYDPEGDLVTIYQTPPGPYSLGTTDVTLTITDDEGLSDQCSAKVTVVFPPFKFKEVARIEEPELTGGLAFIDDRMFFCASSSIYELNPRNGIVLKRFSPGIGGCSIAGNNANGLLYLSGWREIRIIDPDIEVIVGSLIVEPGNIQGLAIRNGKLYATENDTCEVYEIDLMTGKTLRQMSVVSATCGDAGENNILGIEVFNEIIFVSVDGFIHEYDLSGFEFLGVGLELPIARHSAYDGNYLWCDEAGKKEIVKLEVINNLLCFGDLNDDGELDAKDYQEFRKTLSKCEGDFGFNSLADYDEDGCVSYRDYRIWYGYYLDYSE